MIHSSVLMRTAVVRAVNGYREAFEDSEDYDLWLRISERYAFANLPEPVVLYRIHSDQVSQRTLYRQTIAHCTARMAARLRQKGEHDPFWQAEQLSPELLRSIGLTDRAVKQRYIFRLLLRAREMLYADGADAAWQLFEEARREIDESSDRLLRVALLKTRGAIYLHQRRIVPGTWAWLKAICLDPTSAMQFLWRQSRCFFASTRDRMVRLAFGQKRLG
jgi:hypothetical protein